MKNLRRILAVLLICMMFIALGMVAAADNSDYVSAVSDAAYVVKPIPVKASAVYSDGNGDADSSDTGGFALDRIIVRVSGGIVQPFSSAGFFCLEIEDIDDLMTLKPIQDVGIRSIFSPDTLKVLTLKNKGRDAVASAIEKLNNTPGIVYAEPDYIVNICDAIPNDPHFNTPSMWGMKKIQAPAAWEINTGSNAVVVAVIDTGIDHRHPDLAANMWHYPGGVTGEFDQSIHGWSFIWGEESRSGTFDLNGHGSHVAGIIGAVGNNGSGTVGVSWNVQMMAIRTLVNGDGFTSDIIKAIDYARLMKAPIINNSYGGLEYSQAEKDAIDNTDALFVVAAGNDSKNNDSVPVYPASYNCPNIITVAATTFDDSLASFSNYGAASVHIAAPGDRIFSTSPADTYSVMSGTSMAAPYVTGAAALILAANPGMTAQQLKTRLLASVDPVPALDGKVASGGRLNVHRALNPSMPAAAPYTPVFPPEPPPFTGFAGGDGSLGTPYKVSTPAQLNAVRDYPNGHFIQINDIDMTYDTQNQNGAFYSETMGWEPIDYFSGTYNGDGHKITGLKQGRGSSSMGLFNNNAGSIINLGLENCNFVGGYGGAIVNMNAGSIINCYNAGRVTGVRSYIGGLAGWNAGEIIQCYNTGEVFAATDYTAIVGGITSRSDNSVIINSYNTGAVSSPYALDNRGCGILAESVNNPTIINCYTTGIVTKVYGSGYGAIAADNDSAAIENSFCLGHYGGSVGTILTEAQMKQQSSFMGWDFDSVWAISPDLNNGYPHLRPSAPYWALYVLLEQARDIKKGNYTDASWNALQTAIAAAQAVADEVHVTEQQRIDQYAALQNALEGLSTADKTALTALILQAKAIAKGNYTDASWNALQAAIANAQAVAEKANVTQTQVNTQLSALQSTIEGLAKNPPPNPLKTIFTTKYEATLINWILFFVCFGWIWMWF